MSTIQQQFNSENQSVFVMTPGEYEGPLTVDHPCTIDGGGSTLWSCVEPVLIINSPGVTVKNLRVEYTGKKDAGASPVAVNVLDPSAKLINVEVNGEVRGLPGESELWRLPGVISLGTFAAGKENTFSIDINAAAEGEIINEMKNIRLSAKSLFMGNNSIIFTTDELRDNTIIYGEIFIKTLVLRRIYISGKAMKDAPVHSAELHTPINAERNISSGRVKPPREIIAPVVSDTTVTRVRKGQRVSISEFHDKVIKIVYEHKAVKQALDIDGYIFLLQNNGKVKDDGGLVFFSNPETPNKSVAVASTDGRQLVTVEPDKLNEWVDKVVVCYSIYSEEEEKTFSLVEEPMIRVICGEQELYRFELSGLNIEKTVVAVELYRYKGEWKLNFIGAGYKSGLRQLCESYGVDVE